MNLYKIRANYLDLKDVFKDDEEISNSDLLKTAIEVEKIEYLKRIFLLDAPDDIPILEKIIVELQRIRSYI